MKKTRIFLHVIGWVAFIATQLFLFPKLRQLLGEDAFQRYFIEQSIINIFTFLFFYLNYLFLLPRLYLQKKTLPYVVSVILILVLSVVLMVYIHRTYFSAIPIPLNAQGVPEFSENPLSMASIPVAKGAGVLSEMVLLIGGMLLKVLIAFFLSFGIRLYQRWQIVEKQKHKAELSLLKMQINPHFLFNTLNALYVLALKKSEKAPAAILQLSSIMRYVIHEGNHWEVSLAQEVKYISDYIALQSLRLSPNVTLAYTEQVVGTERNIAPLILVSFIENAFKYGVTTEEPCQIKIDLSSDKDAIHLYVENKKYPLSMEDNEASGIGLHNTKSRLNLIYPNQYTLDIQDTATQYKVALKIILQ